MSIRVNYYAINSGVNSSFKKSTIGFNWILISLESVSY